MFRLKLNSRGQATASEYVLIFFIVVSVAAAMSIYFRRGVQARIYDARNTMVKHVAHTAKANNSFRAANLWAEYEPYYQNTDTTVDRSSNVVQRLLPGGTSGLFEKSINEEIRAQTNSMTAPPRSAR